MSRRVASYVPICRFVLPDVSFHISRHIVAYVPTCCFECPDMLFRMSRDVIACVPTCCFECPEMSSRVSRRVILYAMALYPRISARLLTFPPLSLSMTVVCALFDIFGFKTDSISCFISVFPSFPSYNPFLKFFSALES